ncbi:MAG: metalloregulator ArsR/SmtB family transcription factor [Corynebacterium sp.]|nr:metalloregulator ArsR/SmtB family transcription factor [Corynebacterium sp.]
MYYSKYDYAEQSLNHFGDSFNLNTDEFSVEISEIFRALADPTRLKILYIIALNDPELVTGARISKELGISPPTVTHHITILEQAGFVNRIRTGRRARYEICTPQFSHFNSLIRTLAASIGY